MTLKEQLFVDLKAALKNSFLLETSTLRLLLSSLHNREIEKRGKGEDIDLTDEEVIEVLLKEAKKRQESIDAYEKGGRNDLVDKESKELEIIKKYLPPQLNEEEIKRLVKNKIDQLGVNSPKDFGLVMKELMKELKGKSDASLVSKLVKEQLNG